jgi:5'-3' exonuclease
MIIVDFSAVAHSNILAMDLPPEEDILRHTILMSLKAIYRNHKNKYGEMIIACDSRSWRRDFYPEYKARRRAERESGDTEYWEKMFGILDTLKAEITDNLPWKVVEVKGAEADDVIACLVKQTQEFGYMQEVLIVGADSDYKQLLRYPNVTQYSNATKKYVKEADPLFWLHEAILTGQKGKDDIPNIRGRDDFFLTKKNGEKQKPITQKFIQETWTNRHELDKYMSKDEYRNYIRNRTLIDFACIPEQLHADVIAEWESQPEVSPSLILPYLISKGLNQHIQKVAEFYPPKT